MSHPASYTKIHAELSRRLESSKDSYMVECLSLAIDHTESTRELLDVVRARTRELTTVSDGLSPLAQEIITTAAKAIAENEEIVVLLQERLQFTKQAQEEQNAQVPREIKNSDSPALQKLTRPIQKEDELFISDVERIEKEVRQHRERSTIIAKTAAQALQTQAASQITFRAILAISLLFLENLLVSMIYDTSESDFERKMRRSMADRGLNWTVGQVFGLIPIVGFTFSIWDLARDLMKIRDESWESADSILQFLRTYTDVLSLWEQVTKAKVVEIDRALGRTR